MTRDSTKNPKTNRYKSYDKYRQMMKLLDLLHQGLSHVCVIFAYKAGTLIQFLPDFVERSPVQTMKEPFFF